MVVNKGIKEREKARERDVDMTWREMKCVDKMDEQHQRWRYGAETESFRQIDGDEGRLEIPTILITTHDCSD